MKVSSLIVLSLSFLYSGNFSNGTGEFTMLELADTVREVIYGIQTSDHSESQYLPLIKIWNKCSLRRLNVVRLFDCKAVYRF